MSSEDRIHSAEVVEDVSTREPKLRSVMFENSVNEIGMTFKMGMANQKEAYALQITRIEIVDRFVEVYIRQVGGTLEQLWRRFPKNRCALEYELLIDPSKPYREPKLDLGNISLDHTHP